MPAVASMDETVLRSVCAALADDGLTGAQIGRLLSQSGISDPAPGITKRERLFIALAERQRGDGCANQIMQFIRTALHPASYVDRPAFFDDLRAKTNRSLSFAGYSVNERGEIQPVSAARTITEAEERAGRLRAELQRRKVHPDVLLYCRAELLVENYFHAVFEATKSVAEKIRQKASVTGDGAEIVDAAFALAKGMPLLALNTLQSKTEQDEQKGFSNLVKGMFGMFRNVTGHAPKIHWTVTEQDALDLLTLVSLIHRRLDAAVPTRPNSPP